MEFVDCAPSVDVEVDVWTEGIVKSVLEVGLEGGLVERERDGGRHEKLSCCLFLPAMYPAALHSRAVNLINRTPFPSETLAFSSIKFHNKLVERGDCARRALPVLFT